MDDADLAFEVLVGGLQERFPEIAAQIKDEARRGRAVREPDMPLADRELASAQMRATGTGKLSKTDLSTVNYTDEEKLALLLDAVTKLEESMLTARNQLLQLAQVSGLEASVTFVEPESGEETEVDLASEVDHLRTATDRHGEALRPYLTRFEWTPTS